MACGFPFFANTVKNKMEEPTEPAPKKRGGRRKIKIEFIPDKSRRQITFSKRKAGLMKKAYELTTLTGTQALLLVASETGHVYTFATPKLQPFVTLPEGKNLIQSCLNAAEGDVGEGTEGSISPEAGHMSYQPEQASKQDYGNNMYEPTQQWGNQKPHGMYEFQ